MPLSGHRWIIDAIEEQIARVEVDGNEVRQFPQWLLPAGARAGDVLAVSHRREEDRSILEIQLDPSARAELLERSRRQVENPAGRDGGGRIVL
jgi:Protein of unknown function (DUF3006)